MGAATPETTPETTDDSTEAIALVQRSVKSPEFADDLYYATAHPLKNFGDYSLTLVANAAFLPHPQWIVASRGAGKQRELLLLKADDPKAWNQLMAGGGGIKLDSKDAIARFPLTFLALTAPGERPKWRFAAGDYTQLSDVGAALLKKGWVYKQTAKNVTLQFFSVNRTGKFFSWSLTTAPDGTITALQRQLVE